MQFSFGVTSKSLERQAKDQGFTFGENAEKWEKCSEAIIRLRFNINLPDGEVKKLQNRLFKEMVKDLEEW